MTSRVGDGDGGGDGGNFEIPLVFACAPRNGRLRATRAKLILQRLTNTIIASGGGKV